MAKRHNTTPDRLRISKELTTPERGSGESVWVWFTHRFHFLSVLRAKPQTLTVSNVFRGEGYKLTEWVFSPPLRILDQFEAVAQDAGKYLGAPEGVDLSSFWLDCLSLYLWRRKRGGFRIRHLDSSEGHFRHPVIDDVVEASENFSNWLSKSSRNIVNVVTWASSESRPWKHIPARRRLAHEMESRSGGELWAAGKNREREERTSIVEALRNLGVPYDEWPSMVRAWQSKALTDSKYRHQQFPSQFQPPAYDRLGSQSLDEWRTAADKAWAAHRDEFMAKCQYWESKGFDERIPLPPKPRGPGRGGRNADVKDRYTWAAQRLMGKPWKEIAAGTSTVKKAASRVLHGAGWPTGMREIKSAEASAVETRPKNSRPRQRERDIRNLG